MTIEPFFFVGARRDSGAAQRVDAIVGVSLEREAYKHLSAAPQQQNLDPVLQHQLILVAGAGVIQQYVDRSRMFMVLVVDHAQKPAHIFQVRCSVLWSVHVLN